MCLCIFEVTYTDTTVLKPIRNEADYASTLETLQKTINVKKIRVFNEGVTLEKVQVWKES